MDLMKVIRYWISFVDICLHLLQGCHCSRMHPGCGDPQVRSYFKWLEIASTKSCQYYKLCFCTISLCDWKTHLEQRGEGGHRYYSVTYNRWKRYSLVAKVKSLFNNSEMYVALHLVKNNTLLRHKWHWNTLNPLSLWMGAKKRCLMYKDCQIMNLSWVKG